MAIGKFPWKSMLHLQGGTVEVDNLGDWNFSFRVTDKNGNIEQFTWKPSPEEVRNLTVKRNGLSKSAHSAVQFFWSMYND